jgi:hypothetical protein
MVSAYWKTPGHCELTRSAAASGSRKVCVQSTLALMSISRGLATTFTKSVHSRHIVVILNRAFSIIIMWKVVRAGA